MTTFKISTLIFILLSFNVCSIRAEDVKPDLPKVSASVIDVEEMGAKGDGQTDNTKAVQQAIDKANSRGGCTVRFSKGNILCGPIVLKNNIRLQIDPGVTLTMLPMDRYPGGNVSGGNQGPPDFIYGKNLRDIVITGGGTIEGQGSTWWSYVKDKDKKRPYIIRLDESTRVLIEGITIQNSPMYHIVISGQDTTISKTKVHAPSARDRVSPSRNTDGCVVSGRNILITDCDISVADNNYWSAKETSNLLIRNCRFGTGQGLTIGSSTQEGVNKFTVRDCTFEGTDYGIRIKSDRTRGGRVTGITYENIKMTNVGIPIEISAIGDIKEKRYTDLNKLTTEDAATYPSASVTKTTPIYDEITLRNITATVNSGKRAGLICGIPEAPIGRVTMEDITINADLPFGFYFVKKATLKNVKITTPSGENKFQETNAKISLSK